MNHSISLSWSSLLKVDGWNSLSTQRRASSIPAAAGDAQPASPIPTPIARAIAEAPAAGLRLSLLVVFVMFHPFMGFRDVDFVGSNRSVPTRIRHSAGAPR